MPAQWKLREGFRPAAVLRRLEAARSSGSDGKTAFSGFEIEELLPTIQSMLKFPSAAREADTHTVVWKAISRVSGPITQERLLAEVNTVLREMLATAQKDFILLSAISLDTSGLPSTVSLLNVKVEFGVSRSSPKYTTHQKLVSAHRIELQPTPEHYTRLIARVKAKTDSAAYAKAMRALDTYRALLCMMANNFMQFSWGSSSFSPINSVRLGSRHTMHHPNGTSSRDGLWYEPLFVPARNYRFKRPDIVTKNLRWALRRVRTSNFSDSLVDSLTRFVRALDNPDPSVAFIRLWSALEALVTPGVADYDALVRRCAFLHRDGEYHIQVLTHLRAYRNANVHSAEESENARTHCFQLQMYYINAAWFYIRNAANFESLDQANKFLDLPSDRNALLQRKRLIERALRFTSPRDV